MKEKHVQDAICEYLIYQGFLVLRINSGAAQGEYKGVKRLIRFVWWWALGIAKKSAGVSDVLALRDGRLFAIEVKRPGKANNTSEAQDEFLAAVNRHGGVGIVADSVDVVQAAVEGRA